MRRFNPSQWVLGRVAIGLMLLIATLAAGNCADSGPSRDSTLASSSYLPDGYSMRLDRPNRDAAEFVTTSDDGALRVRTGPAGILYRPDQVANTVPYTARARFTEIAAPVGHREGFGLFIGGQDLDGERQRYTYFLVRGDGRYLIKRRDGPSTVEITSGWELSDAVHVPSSETRDIVNELAITVDQDRARFFCNGEPVADLSIGDLSTLGVVGVRVNHNLEVRVQDLVVEDGGRVPTR